MNDTVTTKNSEFVFRRLNESFDQFTSDVWAAIPLWLLAIVAIMLVARLVYRYTNPASRMAGVKDPVATGLGWGLWLALAALVVWTLVAFYNRETDPTKGTGETVSTLSSSNKVKWYSFTIGILRSARCSWFSCTSRTRARSGGSGRHRSRSCAWPSTRFSALSFCCRPNRPGKRRTNNREWSS